jgi:hypothetical protein
MMEKLSYFENIGLTSKSTGRHFQWGIIVVLAFVKIVRSLLGSKAIN